MYITVNQKGENDARISQETRHHACADGHIRIGIDDIDMRRKTTVIDLGYAQPSATVALKLQWTVTGRTVSYPIGSVRILGNKAHVRLFKTPPFPGELVFQSGLDALKVNHGALM